MKNGATDSSEDLISALKRGEIGSFKVLFEKHRDPMLRVAVRILGNRADAEDAIQDAFLALYRKAGAFQGGSSFNTWFYRIVVNACLKIRRKRQSMRKVMERAAIKDKPVFRRRPKPSRKPGRPWTGRSRPCRCGRGWSSF